MTSDIRAKRRPSDWRRAPGISAGRTGERDLVVLGVRPWISYGTDVFSMLRVIRVIM